MIWECVTCRRRWKRPIAKCTFCGGALATRENQVWVVKGFSEVFVPSPGHEEVPYFVTLLENRLGERRLRKTFVRPSLEQVIDLSPQAPREGRSTVALSRVGYVALDAVSRCLTAIGPHQLGADTRVLLKPNLVFEMPASTGVVTNPQVVEAVIRYLLEQGVPARHISVGDGAAIGFDTMRAAKKSGMDEVCRRFGVRFIDFNRSEYVSRTAHEVEDAITYRIAREVFEHDLLINIPVVKTHFQVGISCALKNMKGVLAAETRKRMHRRDIQMMIAEMNSVLPPYVTVADATIGLEGMGPSVLGTPAHFGLVLASRDPVALDATVCRLFHWPVPKFVSLAAQMGVGTADPASIDVVGEEVKVVEGEYDLPTGEFSPHPSVKVVDGAGCSGCSNTIWLALQDLTKQLDYTEARVAMLFGTGGADEAREIGYPLLCVGACAQHLSAHAAATVKGCPPSREEITAAVRTYLEALESQRSGIVPATGSTGAE
jgi:uncharacterized protein (DUF362 family)